MRLRLLIAAIAVVASLIQPATADSVKVGALELTDLWARATPPKAPTAGGYLTITNTGDTPDRLVAVSSPLAEGGTIHEMKVEDGVMTMRRVDDGIEIPPKGTVTLAPGGMHLMFVGPKEPLVNGGKLPVTLGFAGAGTIDTVLHIMPIGSKGPIGAAAAHGHTTTEPEE